MTSKNRLPRWLKPANLIVTFFNRLGLALGTQHILSIPGRKSGNIHSTPVSLVTVDGKRYIVTGYDTEWVKNARASGWGYLTRGRNREQVAMVELPVEQRPPILRQFPVQVPHGLPFFERILGLPANPDTLAQAAPRCPVFRLDPMTADGRQ